MTVVALFGLFLLSVSSHHWCKATFCNTLRDTMLISDESNCNDNSCFKRSIRILHTLPQKLELVNKAFSIDCSLNVASAFLGMPKSTLKSWTQSCPKIAQRVNEVHKHKKHCPPCKKRMRSLCLDPLSSSSCWMTTRRGVGILTAFWKKIDAEVACDPTLAACCSA